MECVALFEPLQYLCTRFNLSTARIYVWRSLEFCVSKLTTVEREAALAFPFDDLLILGTICICSDFLLMIVFSSDVQSSFLMKESWLTKKVS